MKVIAGSPDAPLRIGPTKIPCFVLEDETRVLTQRGIYSALNGEGATSGAQITRFVGRNWIKGFISDDLELVLKSSILFWYKERRMLGYPASILPDLCSSIMAAHMSGTTNGRQKSIVEQASILLSAFATVGIIALIDEVTGYQELRRKKALQEVLDRYLKPEHSKWAKRFPDEFSELMFKLRGWPWRGMKINRPQCVGKYTNQIVWDRLAPGLLKELQNRNPVGPSGNRQMKHHQWLTDDFGHPQLQIRLQRIIGMMEGASSWGHFLELLTHAYPKPQESQYLPFDKA